MTRDQIIDHYVDRLRTLGARNVDEYQSRLRSNAGNLANLNNFLSEAAALMLRDYGAEVTMQDRPDLAAVLKDKRFYVEVKHFNRKGQDDLNDEAERNTPEGEFVLLEHTARSEGKTRYRQIADVAIRKADQYREGEINILIIDSDSETLHLMAGSGAQEFSDDKQSEPPDSPLHRLNGIMVMTSLIGVRGGHWNVDFAITRCPARRMSFRVLRALAEIRMGTVRQKKRGRGGASSPSYCCASVVGGTHSVKRGPQRTGGVIKRGRVMAAGDRRMNSGESGESSRLPGA